MRIAVLANPDSWYFRDLARAAAALQLECSRADFTQLTAVIRQEAKPGSSSSRASFVGAESPADQSLSRALDVRPSEIRLADSSNPQSTIRNPQSCGSSSNQDSSTIEESPADQSLSRALVQLHPEIRLTIASNPQSAIRNPQFCDVLLVRTMPPGSLEQVVFRMDALARLEAEGVRVINSPKSLECAVDKYLTTSKCHAAGLLVPDTVVCETEDAALAAWEMLGGDVVVKPLFGAEGRGILRVSDPDLALRTFRTLSRLQTVLYVQRFIPHPGFDVRVLVIDGEILGGMKRFAADGDFRTNVSRQARAEKHLPTAAECDLALRAASATGAWFAGVDLLYDRDGRCYVIEVNAVPGWKAFGRVNDLDIATVFLNRIGR